MQFSRISPDVHKGSWRWTLYVAELATWGAGAVLLLVLLLAELSPRSARNGWLLAAGLALWIFVFFRIALPRATEHEWIPWVNLAIAFAFATALFAVFRGEVPSAQLVFIPVIAIAGLLSKFRTGFAAGVAGAVLYWTTAELTGDPATAVAGALNASIFILSGSVAGALSSQLRSHYQGEQEEHRLATSVRHRLLAVLDSVDESIVFRDRHGVVRVVNQRAARLFEIDPDLFLGMPANELLRTIARLTEDPEDFMETFQQLRDEPDKELRVEVEQIIPHRRQLRLYSGPMLDDSGALVGRIDVYTDVTESVRRAAEVERLYEEARRVAESYQRALLPDSIPNLPRLNMVAHYLPARGRRAVCGDFYDFVSLPEGRIGVVLGDVCGIGPRAANDAALSRYTLRSFAVEESDPAELVRKMNVVVNRQSDSERFMRMLIGVLDPERALLTYVNAGHVAPVLYRCETQTVEWLSEGGLALGIEGDVDYKATNVSLHPGDMLVFYSDGVTEGTRHGRVFGQAKLTDIVEQYGVGTPGELVQAIRRAVEAWAPTDELRDDVALLVCQVVPDAAIGEPARELVLPNHAARISDVRVFVAAFLADLRAPVAASQEMVLAVSEAAANAARHGRSVGGSSEIRVGCKREGSEAVVVVADDGPGIDPARLSRHELPDRFASGGRGLFLMYRLVDSVDVESDEEGTKITLRRMLFE